MSEKVYRAGLIPLYVNTNNINESKMMFMVPSDSRYGGSDPQIAKGQLEGDEHPQEAALREAHEELGLRSEHIIQVFDCGLWLGRTYLYVAVVNSMKPEDYDIPHFETESVHWLTIKEFDEKGRDIHKPVVNNVFDLITMTIQYDDNLLQQLKD